MIPVQGYYPVPQPAQPLKNLCRIKKEENLVDIFSEQSNKNKLIIVMYSLPEEDCKGCKVAKPLFKELASKVPDCQLVYINVEAYEQTSDIVSKITLYPTLMYVCNNRILALTPGFNLQTIHESITFYRKKIAEIVKKEKKEVPKKHKSKKKSKHDSDSEDEIEDSPTPEKHKKVSQPIPTTVPTPTQQQLVAMQKQQIRQHLIQTFDPRAYNITPIVWGGLSELQQKQVLERHIQLQEAKIAQMQNSQVQDQRTVMINQMSLQNQQAQQAALASQQAAYMQQQQYNHMQAQGITPGYTR